MKTTHIALAALALFLFMRGHAKAAQRDQVEESVPRAGTDFVTDIWTQLNGGGMTAPGYRNLAAGPVADPGRIGTLQAGVAAIASWNGDMRAEAGA